MALLLLVVFQCSFSHAATIRLVRELSTPEVSAIVIIGEIAPGDANEFLGVVADTKDAIVFLNSDGGNAIEGLALAKLIKKLGYATAVIGEFRCMSACALIWIGGKTRIMSKSALVGFHSVYTDQGVSSDGNAIYGAFYGQLGLSDSAIRYLTSAPPNGFNQVTLDTAPLLDIAVLPWNDKDSQTSNESSQNVVRQPSDGFSTEQGVDVIGFDLPGASFQTESLDSCHAACSANSKCNAYTFDTKNHVCYQKNSGKLLLKNPNAFSGARASVNQSLRRSDLVIYGRKDSPGFDLRTLATPTLEECVFECDGEPSCTAFSWNKKNKSCILKAGHSEFILDKNMTSGIK